MKICEDCGQERKVPEEISGYTQARYCKECRRKRDRARSSRAYYANPQKYRAYNDAWKKRNRDKQRTYEKRAYEKAVSTPEGREAYRERARMTRRLQRERQGKPVAAVSLERYRERYGYGWSKASLLPAGPLRELVEQELRGLTKDELATIAGIPERRVYGLVTERVEHVSLPVADRLCMAMNIPLALVYPEAS